MSTSGDNIRNNLAKPPDVETDNTSKKLLEEQNDLSKFRELMRGEPCWYYNEWKYSAARNGSNNWAELWGDSDEEKLNKLKSFELWAIADLGMRGNDLHHTATYMSDGAEYARTSFEPVWEGDSGEAARESLKKFSKACTDAATAWAEFGSVASSLCGEIKGAIEDLIYWGSQGAPRTAYLNHYSNLNDSSADDHLEDMRDIFSSVEEESGEISPGDSAEHIAHVIDTTFTWESTYAERIKWLDDHNNNYSEAITAYRDQVDTTIRTVEGLLNTFGDTVGSPSYLADLNPLAAVRPAKEKDPGDDAGSGDDGRGNDGKDDGKDKGGTGSPGTGSPGTGSPGTGSPGTGSPGTGSPGTGSPETDAAEAGGKPEPGKNPVTGQPLEIDPATGQPYPIDPTTGQPIKDAGDDQDTTVVQHGDREVTVTEPSKTGEMQVGVDDGKGGTKNYQLDFDPNKNPDDGKDAKDGSVGGSAGGLGPSGSGGDKVAAGGKGGSVEDQVHTPGEDGKIRIKDGDVEIVAEQPLGPDGATVVTIDDGKGEPTTQILGDKEDVEEYQRKLAEDETRLSGYRDDMEGRERVSKAEWDELKEQEESHRERGGSLDVDDEKGAHRVDDDAPKSGEERSTPKSVFDDATDDAKDDAKDEKSSGIGKSVFDDDDEDDAKGGGAGVGGSGASGMSGSSGGGGGGASGGGGGIGGSAQELDPGARSGVGAPTGGAPGAGVGTTPGGAEPAAAASGARGGAGAGMMGAPMGGMGGGGGGGGDDQQRSTNAAYQTNSGLFEPELAEGPFGVARISGSLDDEEA